MCQRECQREGRETAKAWEGGEGEEGGQGEEGGEGEEAEKRVHKDSFWTRDSLKWRYDAGICRPRCCSPVDLLSSTSAWVACDSP